jgi:hypothetical protein
MLDHNAIRKLARAFTDRQLVGSDPHASVYIAETAALWSTSCWAFYESPSKFISEYSISEPMTDSTHKQLDEYADASTFDAYIVELREYNGHALARVVHQNGEHWYNAQVISSIYKKAKKKASHIEWKCYTAGSACYLCAKILDRPVAILMNREPPHGEPDWQIINDHVPEAGRLSVEPPEEIDLAAAFQSALL